MHGITDTIVHLVLQHWLSLTATVLVAWLVKNRYHNGLSKFPGPFLASLTDWWRFFDVYGQRADITHRALHKKYGDVVRLGPNSLSFADPKALKTIYGLNKGFVKVHTQTCFLGLLFPYPPRFKFAPLTDTTTPVRFLCGPAVRCERPQLAIPLQHRRQRFPRTVPAMCERCLCHVGPRPVRALRRQHH